MRIYRVGSINKVYCRISMPSLTPKEAEKLMNAYKAVYTREYSSNDDTAAQTTPPTESSENNK